MRPVLHAGWTPPSAAAGAGAVQLVRRRRQPQPSFGAPQIAMIAPPSTSQVGQGWRGFPVPTHLSRSRLAANGAEARVQDELEGFVVRLSEQRAPQRQALGALRLGHAQERQVCVQHRLLRRRLLQRLLRRGVGRGARRCGAGAARGDHGPPSLRSESLCPERIVPVPEGGGPAVKRVQMEGLPRVVKTEARFVSSDSDAAIL